MCEILGNVMAKTVGDGSDDGDTVSHLPNFLSFDCLNFIILFLILYLMTSQTANIIAIWTAIFCVCCLIVGVGDKIYRKRHANAIIESDEVKNDNEDDNEATIQFRDLFGALTWEIKFEHDDNCKDTQTVISMNKQILLQRSITFLRSCHIFVEKMSWMNKHNISYFNEISNMLNNKWHSLETNLKDFVETVHQIPTNIDDVDDERNECKMTRTDVTTAIPQLADLEQKPLKFVMTVGMLKLDVAEVNTRPIQFDQLCALLETPDIDLKSLKNTYNKVDSGNIDAFLQKFWQTVKKPGQITKKSDGISMINWFWYNSLQNVSPIDAMQQYLEDLTTFGLRHQIATLIL